MNGNADKIKEEGIMNSSNPFIFYKYALPYLCRYKKYTIFLIFIIILNAVCSVIIPFIIKSIIDDALPSDNTELLSYLLVILVLGSILAFTLYICTNILSAKLGTLISSDIRFEMLKKIHTLKTNNFKQISATNVLQICTDEFTMVNFVIMQVMWPIIFYMIYIMFGFLLLVHLNWALSIIVFILLPLIIYFANIFSNLSKSEYARKSSDENQLFFIFKEDIQLHSDISILGLQDYRDNNIKQNLNSLMWTDYLYNVYILLTKAMINIGVVSIQLFLIALGSYWIFIGDLSLGSFFAFITMYTSFAGVVCSLSEHYPALIRGADRFGDIRHLLSLHVDMENDMALTDLPKSTNYIEFENISLDTHDGKNVLSHINLTISKGESVGIVGKSGSGKSALINLFLKLEIPREGMISLDGKDIYSYPSDLFLQQIGSVTSKSGLFQMSIADNIRMGNLNATFEEIMNAAIQGGIHDEIIKMKDGYDTIILPDSQNLSAGQEKRILLARALVRNPSILILDDATAALDIINADAISKTLANQMRGRTTIMVTHNIMEVVNLNKIHVIANGKIIESGNHKELVKMNGIYHEMWIKQSGVSVSPDEREYHIKLSWLRSVPLFSTLNDKILKLIIDKFDIEELSENKMLFDENSLGEKFYIIVKGRVQVSKMQDNGQRKTIAILENGDYFGEISLLYSTPRTARISTLESCIFLVLHSTQFISALNTLPKHTLASIKKIASTRLQKH